MTETANWSKPSAFAWTEGREQVGVEYTWAWRGDGDSYTRAFSGLLTTLNGYLSGILV